MKDPLEELLDTLPEIDDIQVRSKFIIIAARLNKQNALRVRVLDTMSEILQDVRVNVAAMKHDLAATRRERDALA